MGIPLDAFDCRNELRNRETDSTDANSDKFQSSLLVFWLKFICILLQASQG